MNKINTEKLREQLLTGTFYYHKSNLLVKGKIHNILSYDDGELEIFFDGGIVSAYNDKIDKVRRPANIISVFKWCYILKDEYNECVGYIGEKEEKEI